MRAYRQMKALNDLGHDISLLYFGYGDSMKGTVDDFWAYKEKTFNREYPLSHFPRTLMPSRYKHMIKDLQKRKGDFDLVQSYSSPDVLGVAATRYCKAPVIFDERDMVTAFDRTVLARNYIPPVLLKNGFIMKHGSKIVYNKMSKLEREANLNSQARVYASDYMYELAKKKYPIPKKNNLVFYNYALKSDLNKSKKKLSKEDGEIHIVYEGVLAVTGYRMPLLDFLVELSKKEFHVHIYGYGSTDVMKVYTAPEKKNKFYHFHGGLPLSKLVREMTQYDFGLLPFPGTWDYQTHLDTGLSNKIFDYLISGLPIIVPPLKSMKKFTLKEKVGFVFNDMDEIVKKAGKYKGTIDREKYTIENNIDKLLQLYKDVI